MEIEVRKFKKLILDMYRGFPNWRYHGMVEKIIKTEEDRKQLIDQGYLIREPNLGKYTYGLGANALLLVNAWKMEQGSKLTAELTKGIYTFTIFLIAIALLQIVLMLINSLG